MCTIIEEKGDVLLIYLNTTFLKKHFLSLPNRKDMYSILNEKIKSSILKTDYHTTTVYK